MGIKHSAKVTIDSSGTENVNRNEVMMEHGKYIAPIAENDEVRIYSTKLEKPTTEKGDKKFVAYRVINTKLAQGDGRYIVRPKNSLNAGATLTVRPLKNQSNKIYYVVNKGSNVDKWLKGDYDEVPNRYDKIIREATFEINTRKSMYSDKKADIADESLDRSIGNEIEPKTGKSGLDETNEWDDKFTARLVHASSLPQQTLETSPRVRPRYYTNKGKIE
jgi:hypothetical protein